MSAVRGGRGVVGGGQEVIKGFVVVRLLGVGFIVPYRGSSTLWQAARLLMGAEAGTAS